MKRTEALANGLPGVRWRSKEAETLSQRIGMNILRHDTHRTNGVLNTVRAPKHLPLISPRVSTMESSLVVGFG